MGLIDKFLGGSEEAAEDIDQLEARKQRARERGRKERRKEFRQRRLEKEKKKGRRKALSLGERFRDVADKAGKKTVEAAKDFEVPEPDDSGGGGGEAFLDDSGATGEEFLDDFGGGSKNRNDDMLDF